MVTRRSRWLVAYDIVSPRRLARVHRFLKRHALATQYSVFTVETDPAGLQAILAGVGRRIDRRRDDVRLYPIGAGTGIAALGRPPLPRGLLAPNSRPRPSATVPNRADCPVG